ncbi:hypothetical protein PSPO01_09996 [Paraphaeosphaeria sporulosa]
MAGAAEQFRFSDLPQDIRLIVHAYLCQEKVCYLWQKNTKNGASSVLTSICCLDYDPKIHVGLLYSSKVFSEENTAWVVVHNATEVYAEIHRARTLLFGYAGYVGADFQTSAMLGVLETVTKQGMNIGMACVGKDAKHVEEMQGQRPSADGTISSITLHPSVSVRLK